MKPNTTNLLEANTPANSLEGPQNENIVEENNEVMGPRRSCRVRKVHSMWQEYAKWQL
jgi:hypothetical protein